MDELTARGAERSVVAGRPRPSLTILVDLNQLLGLHARTSAELLAHRCELADGTVLSLAQVLALSADSTINTILGHFGITGEFHPIGEITSKRHADARQRRSLVARDQTCVFAGCDRRGEWCDAHHVDGWEQTHQTSTPRLVLLCSFHHHLIHGPDIDLTVETDGTVQITRRDGSQIPNPPPGQKVPPDPDLPPPFAHPRLAERRHTLTELAAHALARELQRDISTSILDLTVRRLAAAADERQIA